MTTKNKNKGQIANPDELITALYCRLSVEDMKDHDKKKGEIDESNSITNQKQILLDYAKKHSYKNTMFFVDDGISGTNTKKRDEFNRMIDECMAGKIDMIITKSISRFARNTLDCLKYIRELKDKKFRYFLRKRTSTRWILKERFCLLSWHHWHSRKVNP